MTGPAALRTLVVGNGMAGHRLLAELARRGAARGTVAIGAEPRAAYNRIQLSAVLAGDRTTDDIALADRAWYATNGIDLVTGDAVAAIDRAARQVRTASGREFFYDRLVLATGSRPIRLDLEGSALAGVVTFRDLDDVAALCALGPGARAVVIGGGLLGLEAAEGLRRRGAAVDIVHLADDLMERQLDAPAARLLADALAARGIALHLSTRTQAILGERGRVAALRLADGKVLPADLVVMAVGVVPDAELARQSGLACGRGVVVDDTMATDDPAVFALGECVEHRGRNFGLVGPIWDQARVLADVLCGRPAEYAGGVPATSLKVSGIDLFSAGTVREGADAETLVLSDPAARVYRKLVLRGGRLEGAVLYGDVADSGWYAGLIADGADIAPLRDRLAFGRAHAEPAAAMPLAAD